MEPYVRNFIRSSLVWFGIGIVIGVCMAFMPYRALAYRPAHAHANLLGFVSMMIFGVAYHVMPRFNGRGLHSVRLAQAHLLTANLGLALLVGGFITRVTWAKPGAVLLAAGGATSAVAAFMFIFNIWKTIAPRTPAIQIKANP
jgi:cbb3-type cytochrome oxidase subunit 1